MVVCKCRRATKQYCFVHKVGVCPQCVVEGEHNCCVVKTYAEWVVDGDYAWPPACGFCRAPLVGGDALGAQEVGGENVRLGCKHVVHTGCLDAYLANSPESAVASDFQCPSCTTPVWPPPRDVYPEGSKFSERLKEVLMRNPGKAERLGVAGAVDAGAAGDVPGAATPNYLASPHRIDIGAASPVVRGGGGSGRFGGGPGRQPSFEGEGDDDDGGKGRGKSVISYAPLFVQQMVGAAGRECRLPLLDPMMEGLAGKPLGSGKRKGRKTNLATAVFVTAMALVVLLGTASVLLGRVNVSFDSKGHPHRAHHSQHAGVHERKHHGLEAFDPMTGFGVQGAGAHLEDELGRPHHTHHAEGREQKYHSREAHPRDPLDPVTGFGERGSGALLEDELGGHHHPHHAEQGREQKHHRREAHQRDALDSNPEFAVQGAGGSPEKLVGDMTRGAPLDGTFQ